MSGQGSYEVKYKISKEINYKEYLCNKCACNCNMIFLTVTALSGAMCGLCRTTKRLVFLYINCIIYLQYNMLCLFCVNTVWKYCTCVI